MNYKAIANKLRELADLFDGKEATEPKRRKPQGNLVAIGGVIVSEFRTEKVIKYEINADNVEKPNPITCVIFHNKGNFNYKKGDNVNFNGTFQTNTFKGKTTENFVVEEDLTNDLPKNVSPTPPQDNGATNELPDDEIPF